MFSTTENPSVSIREPEGNVLRFYHLDPSWQPAKVRDFSLHGTDPLPAELVARTVLKCMDTYRSYTVNGCKYMKMDTVIIF